MRRLVCLIVLSLICTVSFAQSKYFYGKIIDSITLLPVQDVQVLNMNSHEGDVTNSRGLFVLQGNLNDTLQFIRVGYWQQRFILQGNLAARDTLQIMFIPRTEELQAVTVSAYSYKDYQQDSADRRNDFKDGVGYAHHLFESSNSGSGLGFSLDRIFDSKQKKKRQAFRYFAQNEEQEYINFRFNPILLHSLTALKGAQLQDFIIKNEPSYKWLRQHPSYDDIVLYVNDKLREYHK